MKVGVDCLSLLLMFVSGTPWSHGFGLGGQFHLTVSEGLLGVSMSEGLLGMSVPGVYHF